MEKRYKIEANSITGVMGRIMSKGEVVPESWLINHEEHIGSGHISEYQEEAAPAPEKEPSQKPGKSQKPDGTKGEGV